MRLLPRGLARAARVTGPLLLLPALVGCDGAAAIVGTNQLVPFERPVAADGTTVTLRWTGSSCAELRRALVDETELLVEIELMIRETSSDCSGAPVEHTSVIELDAPLGDRAVVDAACDHAEFADHPSCEDTST